MSTHNVPPDKTIIISIEGKALEQVGHFVYLRGLIIAHGNIGKDIQRELHAPHKKKQTTEKQVITKQIETSA